MRSRPFLLILLSHIILSTALVAQTQGSEPYDSLARQIVKEALGSNKAYEMLSDLCTNVGHRLSGSPAAAKAVQWAEKKMQELGFDNVHLEPVMVPHWVRGPFERAYVFDPSGKRENLAITALGGTIGTPKGGITAEVLEVKSFEELHKLGEKAKGKIVFFSRPMDRTLVNTFEAYGRAVDQRGAGAVEAAKVGGVAALVRSMTTRRDNVPHTGAMHYDDSVEKVPAAAVSIIGAERLSALLASGKPVRVHMEFSAQTLPDVESANVMGELRGTEKPEEVIVIGGHLDSWDKGQGANDDGAGCVQSIEALRLLKTLGLKPKRTIRAVMFMNEENGLRGGIAYAEKKRPGEKAVAAIESDMGSFQPVGFGIGDSAAYEKLLPWAPVFRFFNADHFQLGGGGADISPLAQQRVPLMDLIPEVQRYFDYHHSDNDTIEGVNERELALGAAALAIFSYIIAQEGL
jgi:carboxypeptidase Q